MNATTKGNSPLQLRLNVAVPFVSILTIIGLTSLATNAIIVVIICKYWKRRKGYELFMLQGTVIDLVTTVITIPFWVLIALHHNKFDNGIVCKLNASVCFIDIVAPVIFLMLAAAYRHTALMGHEAYKRIFTIRRSYTWVLLGWILSILLCLPQNFAWVSKPEVTCIPDFVSNIWFSLYMLVFFFFLPLGATIYAHIFDIFLFQPEKMSNKTGPLYHLCTKRALRGKELEIQKSMLTVVAVHTCCWLPYVLLSIAQNLADTSGFYVMGVSFHFITLTFGLAGMSLKGTLYSFENPRIKSHIKELFGLRERTVRRNTETDG